MNDGKPFSVKQLAERLGCNQSHIYRMIENRQIKAFRFGGKLLRISAQEVERWENTDHLKLDNTDLEASGETPAQSGKKKDVAAVAFDSARR